MKWVVWLLVIGSVNIIFDRSAFESFDLPKRAFLALALVLAILLLLAMSFSRHTERTTDMPLAVLPIGLVVLIVLFGFSFLRNDWRAIFPFFVRVVLYLVAGIVLFYCSPRGTKEFPTLFWVFIGFSAFHAVVAMLQFAGFDPFFGYATGVFVGPQRFRRMIAFAGYSNYTAGLIATTVPLGIYLAFREARRSLRIRALAVLFLLTIALAMSKARAAMLAAFFGSAIMLVCLSRQSLRRTANAQRSPLERLKKTLLVCAAVLTVLWAFWFTGAAHRWRDALTMRDFAATQRLRIWRNTVKLIRQRPLFGYGAGSFGFWYPRSVIQSSDSTMEREKSLEPSRLNLAAADDGLGSRSLNVSPADLVTSASAYSEYILEAHNEYLQLIFELGILPCAVCVLLLLQAVRRYKRALKTEHASSPQGLDGSLRLAVVASLSTFGIDSFFSFPLRVLPSSIPGVAMLSLLFADYARRQPIRSGRKGQRAVLSITAVIMIPVLCCQWRELKSSRGFVEDLTVAQSGSVNMTTVDWAPHKPMDCPWDGARLAYRGAALLASGETARAHDLLQDVMKFYSDPRLLMNAGRAALLSGDLEAAECDYELAIRSGFRLTDNIVNLAVVHQHKNEPRKALEFLQVAQRLSPTDNRVNLEMGRTQLALGEAGEAESLLRRVSAKSDSPELRILIIMSLYLQRKTEEAGDLLERSLEAFPRSSRLADLRQKLELP